MSLLIDEMDAFFMARAIELAKKGRFTTTPNPNVGSVLVKNGEIIAEGYHQKAGEAHAEVNALKQAADNAKDSTAYVTLEPCNHHGKTPPCVDALIAAGVKRVVVAMQDPNPKVGGLGIKRLQEHGIEVSCGVLQQEAETLNLGFLKRMRSGMPYVRLKLATSLDGRIAMASGESQWITSSAARRDVQNRRAESCAILSTSATVLADNPSLTVRWHELSEEIQGIYPHSTLRQPIRVIIDSKNRITSQHKLISEQGATWLARLDTTSQEFDPGRVEQISIPASNDLIDLTQLLGFLAHREVNTVWVEAGAELAGALIEQKLVDELIIYVAPKLLGHNAKAAFNLLTLNLLKQAPEFEFFDVRTVGPDLCLTLKPKI